jgi:hypothetical protein
MHFRPHKTGACNYMHIWVHEWGNACRILFRWEITLDNGVFSDDQIEVSRNKAGLSLTAQETGIKGISSNCMMVYWEIVEKKAGLCVGKMKKEENDAA